MAIDKIPSAGIDSGGVAPSNLSTGAPSWDTSGNFQFNSGYGSVATAYGCRAWVNFNGTGTVAIRASGNVSSITDGGSGLYTVNFTTAMPDANYCALCTGEHFPGVSYTNGATVRDATRLTTSVQLNYFNNSGTLYDVVSAYAAIFR
jgi:hypothetical protein